MERLAANERRVIEAYECRGFPAHESAFAPGHLFLVPEQAHALTRCLERMGRAHLAEWDVLEAGCGTGRWLRELVQWGADPHRARGVDLLPDRIARAEERCAPGVRVQVANAGSLPFDDHTFDIVFQSTVLTSILDGAVRRVGIPTRCTAPHGCRTRTSAAAVKPSSPPAGDRGRRASGGRRTGQSVTIRPSSAVRWGMLRHRQMFRAAPRLAPAGGSRGGAPGLDHSQHESHGHL